MENNHHLASLKNAVDELTTQLVHEKVVWQTCKDASGLSLQLIEEELEKEPDTDSQLCLTTLQSNFSGILSFDPEVKIVDQGEVVQYKRYHVILALDSIKKLLAYYSGNENGKGAES